MVYAPIDTPHFDFSLLRMMEKGLHAVLLWISCGPAPKRSSVLGRCSMAAWLLGLSLSNTRRSLFLRTPSSPTILNLLFSMSTTPQDIPSQPRLDDGPAADGSSGRQKRRRKVLSCFTCRQRKLKCDREYPSCNRCRKAGCANTCAYDVALDSNPISDDRPSPMSAAMGEPARVPATTFLRRDDFAHVPWPKEFPKRKPRFPERRPASLESRIARLERTARLSPNDSEEESQPRLGEAMLLKGKSYKTQFYGATSTWCTISNVSILR